MANPTPMPLAGLEVILVNTRFPENIGMAARACANMGCPNLSLVAPERWNLGKARKLATPKGLPILEKMRLFPSIREAVGQVNMVLGTTARTGGWRKSCQSPRKAAREIAAALHQGEKVAILFGPEDRGLLNSEIGACQFLINIPTSGGASSLNLAQAVLLVLYECAKPASCRNGNIEVRGAQRIGMEERLRLESELKKLLLNLDCLHGNPGYFFLQWSAILSRARLKRHEYDALMGFCRRLAGRLGLNMDE